VLKVSVEDDHGKNTHFCVADYQLVITGTSESEPVVQTLLSSDADWDRSISVRLNGFSRDGRNIFGVLSEGGNGHWEKLFDYNTPDGKVRLFDLEKQLNGVAPANCHATTDVVGTTEGDTMVVELSSANHCTPNTRWLLNTSSGRLQRLAETTPVVGLFDSASVVPEK
jgi:hypothetical protein